MTDILDKQGAVAGFKSFMRTVGVALVTAAIIIGGIQLTYGHAAVERDQLARVTAQQTHELVSTLRAGWCVLGLDIGPDGERNAALQDACWTNEGLTRPVP